MPDESAWTRRLMTVLRTLAWPNTVFAVFTIYVLIHIWSHGLTGPLFEDRIEFLIVIPVVAAFFNLLALNKEDHFLLGCTISLSVVLGVFYVVNTSSTLSRPLADTSRQNVSQESARSHPLPPQTGTHVIPLQGTKGVAAIKIINTSRSDAAVKLVDNAGPGRARMFVYLRSNTETTVNGIENGSYIIRFALGSNWDRQLRKFRSGSAYFQLIKPLDVHEEAGRKGLQKPPREVRLDLSRATRIDNGMFMEGERH